MESKAGFFGSGGKQNVVKIWLRRVPSRVSMDVSNYR